MFALRTFAIRCGMLGLGALGLAGCSYETVPGPVSQASVVNEDIAQAQQVQGALVRLEKHSLDLADELVKLNPVIQELAQAGAKLEKDPRVDAARLHPSLIINLARVWEKIRTHPDLAELNDVTEHAGQWIRAAEFLEQELNEFHEAMTPHEWARDGGGRAKLTLRSILSAITAAQVHWQKVETALDQAHQRNDPRLLALVGGRDTPAFAALTRLLVQARLLIRCAAVDLHAVQTRTQQRGTAEHSPADCRTFLTSLNATLMTARGDQNPPQTSGNGFWHDAQLRSARTFVDHAALVIPRLAGGRAREHEVALFSRYYANLVAESMIRSNQESWIFTSPTVVD